MSKSKDKIEYSKVISIVVFLFLIFSITIVSLLVPVKAFSENENRYLATKPKFTWSSLIEGKYTTEYEEYIIDQFVLRDKWISLKTLTERMLLKQDINSVYFGKDEYLIEKHPNNKVDKAVKDRNYKRLIEFVDKYNKILLDGHVKVMLVPTASNILKDKLPMYHGGSGRYRLGKLFTAKNVDGIILVSSMYENTATILKIIRDKYKNDIKMLLNSFLEVDKSTNYEEDFNIESIELDLEQIERGSILEEDLANIQKLKEAPTDIEYVHNLQVLDICNIEEEDNLYNLQAKIIWYMYDYEEKEVEVEVTYNIEIIKKNDTYYLSAIRPMEK